MKIRNIAIAAIVMALVWSCSDSKSGGEETNEEKTTIELSENDYLVTIKTDLGEMKAILYDETPLHKENFIKLAKDGFYDSLLFHRVMSGFMIQGGDPQSRDATLMQPLGNGGPGYTIPAEIKPEFLHVKGALSAARKSDQFNPKKESSGSQFFIVQGVVTPREQLEGINTNKLGQAYQKLMREQPESDLAKELQAFVNENQNDSEAIINRVKASADELTEATGITFKLSQDKIDAYSTKGGYPSLDGEYTVFGMVVEGLDVIDRIASVKTRNPQREDRPFENVYMVVTVEEMPRADIMAKYGNPYIQ